ncbi:MAG: hypothetical protein ACK47B_27855 [Armatimonadota bacterium]
MIVCKRCQLLFDGSRVEEFNRTPHWTERLSNAYEDLDQLDYGSAEYELYAVIRLGRWEGRGENPPSQILDALAAAQAGQDDYYGEERTLLQLLSIWIQPRSEWICTYGEAPFDPDVDTPFPDYPNAARIYTRLIVRKIQQRQPSEALRFYEEAMGVFGKGVAQMARDFPNAQSGDCLAKCGHAFAEVFLAVNKFEECARLLTTSYEMQLRNDAFCNAVTGAIIKDMLICLEALGMDTYIPTWRRALAEWEDLQTKYPKKDGSWWTPTWMHRDTTCSDCDNEVHYTPAYCWTKSGWISAPKRCPYCWARGGISYDGGHVPEHKIRSMSGARNNWVRLQDSPNSIYQEVPGSMRPLPGGGFFFDEYE